MSSLCLSQSYYIRNLLNSTYGLLSVASVSCMYALVNQEIEAGLPLCIRNGVIIPCIKYNDLLHVFITQGKNMLSVKTVSIITNCYCNCSTIRNIFVEVRLAQSPYQL